MAKYLLLKRGYYWRHESRGYTGIKDEAGRYSEEESLEIVVHDGDTTRVLEERAEMFSPSCDAWVQADYWKRRCLAAEGK